MVEYTERLVRKLQALDDEIEKFTELRTKLMQTAGFERTREYRVLNVKISDWIGEREKIAVLLVHALRSKREARK